MCRGTTQTHFSRFDESANPCHFSKPNMLKPITLPIIALILCCNTADAQLEVPTIFSDHMVMQRNENIKVWGWSKPGWA